MKLLTKTLITLIVCLTFLASFKASAIFYRIDWQPGLGIELTAYNSVIDADNSLFFNQFQWNNANASEVTFQNMYMDSGPAIPALTVSTTENITFSTVTNQEISYSVAANGTQIFRQVSEPLNVTIDGADEPDAWTYNNEILTVNNASSNAIILFSSASLSSDDVLGVAVALFVAAIGVSIGLIYTQRRKRQE